MEILVLMAIRCVFENSTRERAHAIADTDCTACSEEIVQEILT